MNTGKPVFSKISKFLALLLLYSLICNNLNSITTATDPIDSIPPLIVDSFLIRQKSKVFSPPYHFESFRMRYAIIPGTNELNFVSRGKTPYLRDTIICDSIIYFDKRYYVTHISECAFCGEYPLYSIKLPKSLNSIGKNAFSQNGLKGIIIPENVSEIHRSAFDNNRHLSAINVIEENKYFCSVDGVLFDKSKKRLIRCPEGKEGNYVIPDYVEEIADCAFLNCNYLDSITVSENVNAIGKCAFWKCNHLKSILLPSNISRIEDGTFIECEELRNINLPSTINHIGDAAFSECINLEKIILPDNLTKIEAHTFSYCKNLTTINIPENVTEIGIQAFLECKKIQFNIPDKIERIGYNAFLDTPWYDEQPDGIIYINTALYKYKGEMPRNTKIDIPQSITSISAWAFQDQKNLSSITLPKGLTHIGERSFYCCRKLKEIIVPGSVKSIEYEAFAGCNFRKAVIEEGVEKIEAYAFGFNEKLRILFIPESVYFIGKSAFSDLYSYPKKIHVYWQEPSMVDYEEGYDPWEFFKKSHSKLIVPKGTKHLYQQSEIWKDFNIVERRK